MLHNEYTVGNPLGKPGGFGITYLAWYTALELPVAIKEYLPLDLAGRSSDGRTVRSHSLDLEADFNFGIEQFHREARTLAQLSHPNIVRVRGFFRENGTAYLVMDYYIGESLDQLLEKRGGRLPEREAVEIMLPILDALQYVHAKRILHGDVKPSNLYLTAGGNSILLDFGTARSALRERTQSASLVCTPGYAPFEQYHEGDQGPWTDVYAAAATLYKLVTGVVPPSAIERIAKDTLAPPEWLAPGLSLSFSQALLVGLALKAEMRLGDAGELRKLLVEPAAAPMLESSQSLPQADISNTGMSQADWTTDFSTTHRTTARQQLWWRVGAATLLVTLVLVAFALYWPQERQILQPEKKTRQPNRVPVDTPSTPPVDPGRPRVFNNIVDGLTYVWIPPGAFQMGCTDRDEQCEVDERPRHHVEISKGFWLGETEVTVEKYRRFAKAQRRALPESPAFNLGWSKADHPIVEVTWNDAHRFCEWAGGRLPSEAEWEYAARGGLEGGKYPWGNDGPICQRNDPNGAKFYDYNHCGRAGTEPVGSYAANGYGLYDMAGNVGEWCADSWHDSYAGAAADGSVQMAEGASRWVVRGGSWYLDQRFLRVSNRSWAKDGDESFGFRCARDAAERVQKDKVLPEASRMRHPSPL